MFRKVDSAPEFAQVMNLVSYWDADRKLKGPEQMEFCYYFILFFLALY
jgi:hypothetical protein